MNGFPNINMRKKLMSLGLMIFTLMVLLSTSNFQMPAELEKEAQIEWLTFEEAVALNQQNPKKIFIDVYTDWCGWCKVMDKNTFSHPTIAKFIKSRYYAVKFNAEQKEDINFRGHTFKYVPQGRRGYHELAATLMNGRMSYPTVVFLDEQMNLITPVPGYQKPKEFFKILSFIGDNKYKSQNWQEFDKGYESPF